MRSILSVAKYTSIGAVYNDLREYIVDKHILELSNQDILSLHGIIEKVKL